MPTKQAKVIIIVESGKDIAHQSFFMEWLDTMSAEEIAKDIKEEVLDIE